MQFNERAFGPGENITAVYFKDFGQMRGHTQDAITAFPPSFTQGKAGQILHVCQRQITQLLTDPSSSIRYLTIEGNCRVDVLCNTVEKKIEMAFSQYAANGEMVSSPEHVVVIDSSHFPADFSWDHWTASSETENLGTIGESLVEQGLVDTMISGHQHNEILQLAGRLHRFLHTMVHMDAYVSAMLNGEFGELVNTPK